MRILAIALILRHTLGVHAPIVMYVDPGAGSFLLQVLAGSVLGVGYLIFHKFARIRSWLKRRFGADENKNDTDK